MLSIIIPTLNEENYIPFLLESIKKQSLNDNFEVIFSDGGSEDNTVEIAEKNGCKVISKRANLPAIGKNNGANNARGDLIFFIDADVVLPENFLENALAEFKKRNLEAASFYLKSENKFHNFLFHLLYNLPAKITEKIFPQAMNIILVKKDIHQKIGGFDEEIRLGEELDYVRRGAEIGKFGILRSVKILASTRRYQQDGWFRTWFKYFLCQLHMIFLGPVKSDIFKYRFNHYSPRTTFRENFCKKLR